MKTIAVLSALPKESALLFELPGAAPRVACGFEIAERELSGSHVVAVTSGMGKVNAAAAAQYLICHHKLDGLVLSGIAGSLNPALGLGDVVVGKRLECLEANMSVIAEDLPYLESFRSDERLVSLAKLELEARGFERYPSVQALIENGDEPQDLSAGTPSFGEGRPHRPRYVEGAIATSDLFHESSAELGEVRRIHGVDCEEMEGAAVAQVCARAQVPFLAIRTISNPCGMAYEELDRRTQDLVAAARLAATITLGVLSRL